ncbi:MAG: hypothetical protein AABX70_01230 [Nanoarchaeota archaeon]
MKQGFIELQGKIWDAREYEHRLVLIKNFLWQRLEQELFLEGFELSKDRNSHTLGSDLIFYNAPLDLELRVKIKKRSKWVWV